MKLIETLNRVTKLLQLNNCSYAICGGIAASLYRDTPRFTGDVDIALLSNSEKSEQELAEEISSQLNLKPYLGFITDFNNNMKNHIALISCRNDSNAEYTSIDFILPVMPWVPYSVRHAQNNLLDYGFAKLPTIMPEDLIVAKLFALANNPERLIDADDIQQIISTQKNIDRKYILECCNKSQINIALNFSKLLNT